MPELRIIPILFNEPALNVFIHIRDGIYAYKLAREAKVSISQVNKLLNKFSELGLLKRNNLEKREVRYSLTAKGRDAQDSVLRLYGKLKNKGA